MGEKELLALAEMVERAIPVPSQDEWRDHDGGGRPHLPSSYVEVEFRDGVIRSHSSAVLMWPWEAGNDHDDIIRWRFAKEPLSRVQAGDLLIENASTIAAALRSSLSRQNGGGE